MAQAKGDGTMANAGPPKSSVTEKEHLAQILRYSYFALYSCDVLGGDVGKECLGQETQVSSWYDMGHLVSAM